MKTAREGLDGYRTSKFHVAKRLWVRKMAMANVLGKDMHHRLMNIFNDAVVLAFDMKANISLLT